METQAIEDLLSRLPEQHRAALYWFEWHRGTVQPWPDKLADGTLLATKAKGIYKPAWSEYALSVRQTLGSHYPDKEPVRRADGTWRYMYFQEGSDPTARDAEFTNKGLMACRRDGVPVGVMRQVSGKPNVRYDILGLALVVSWERGYFHLEGFSGQGTVHGPGPEGVVPGLLQEIETRQESEGVDPADITDERERVLTAVVRRRGQPAFRRALLARYGSTCPVTGCSVQAVLEATHIASHQGVASNYPENGLLLRSDIRTLFDLGLLAVNEDDLRVLLAPSLVEGPYRTLIGQPLNLRSSDVSPSREALRLHRVWCGLGTAPPDSTQ